MSLTVGQTLKEARDKKAVTLEDVHAKIKIHPRVLQLLEEDKFEKLPSKLFVKSFLKSYAEFLEMNPDEVLSAYEKEGGSVDTEQVLYLKTAAQRDKKSSSVSVPKNFVAAAVALAVFLAAAFAVFHVVKAAGRWISAKKESPRSKNIPKKIEGQNENNEPLDGDWLRSPDLDNFPSIPRKTPLELKIRAVEPVWMRVTCDGKVLFQSTLKKGAVESWSASQRIEIWTGNSSNMILTLNKFALGSPGRGVVKKMVITRDGVRIPRD